MHCGGIGSGKSEDLVVKMHPKFGGGRRSEKMEATATVAAEIRSTMKKYKKKWEDAYGAEAYHARQNESSSSGQAGAPTSAADIMPPTASTGRPTACTGQPTASRRACHRPLYTGQCPASMYLLGQTTAPPSASSASPPTTSQDFLLSWNIGLSAWQPTPPRGN